MEMNLKKLFEMQKVLDERIEKEHPRGDYEDRLSKKLLALQVELGELANEWRGFKFWSKDQEPRTFVPNINGMCLNCDGQGMTNHHLDLRNPLREFCSECDGCGFHFHNPLLEEYVDCLHFILSIGLEDIQICAYDWNYRSNGLQDINQQFMHLFFSLRDFYDEELLESTISLFLGLGEMLGFTPEQIEQAYIDKNEVNHERQNTGY